MVLNVAEYFSTKIAQAHAAHGKLASLIEKIPANLRGLTSVVKSKTTAKKLNNKLSKLKNIVKKFAQNSEGNLEATAAALLKDQEIHKEAGAITDATKKLTEYLETQFTNCAASAKNVIKENAGSWKSTATQLAAKLETNIVEKFEEKIPDFEHWTAEGGFRTQTAQAAHNSLTRPFFKVADKFEKYLGTQSLGGKLGIAASGIVLGGILMQVGGTWLVQGLDGNEPAYTQANDGSTLVVSQPMNPTKRVAKILGGVIAGATGVLGEIGGFFAGYRAFIN